MSLSVTRRNKRHIGNGAATEFAYDFLVQDEDDLKVYLYDTATQGRTLLDAAVYDVTGIDDPDGGTVTYPLSGDPLPSTKWIIIERDVLPTQDMEISNQGGFFPSVLEDQLDRIVMQVQQLYEAQARVPVLIQGETFDNPIPNKA